MGSHHIKAFQGHPNVQVVAVSDVDEERLEHRADELGVDVRYADGHEMIAKESLDIVSIATPNKFHYPLTLAAFEAGANVFCEKPMAMNATEAQEMLQAGRKANRRLMINFSFRFSPQSRALKREVERGTLGDIYYGRTMWMRRMGMPRFGGWFGQKALSGGGPLIDLGVHRLDLALWLMGYPKPVWVLSRTYDHLARERAARENAEFDVEDMAVALVTFENGSTLEIVASWASHIKEGELMETRILGTQAGLVQRNVGEGYDFEAEVYMERDGAQYNLRMHRPAPSDTGPMYHFAESVLNDTPHMATGEEGVVVMQLLDAVYESAKRGEPVKIA
jgi:predicted dehydrogenase